MLDVSALPLVPKQVATERFYNPSSCLEFFLGVRTWVCHPAATKGINGPGVLLLSHVHSDCLCPELQTLYLA